MAFQEKLIDALGSFATTFNSYRYIQAIKSAFITLMPVIIVGAFSVLISNMVLDPKNGLASFQSLSFLAALKPITSALNYATLNFLNIGAVFLIGIELGRINGIKSLFPGLLAVICFICVTPTTVEMLVDGEMHVVKDVLLRQFSDTRSLFLGMFIAILSVEIYCWLEGRKGLKIKMPDTVPPNVSASFSALIPAIITGGLILGFRNCIDSIYFFENGTKTLCNISQFWSGVDSFLWLIGEAIFHMLPVCICWSVTKKMGTTQSLGIVLGLTLVSGQLLNAYGVASTAAADIPKWDFGFFTVNMIGYQAQVIPAILAAFTLVYLERFFRKICPAVISMIVVPFCSLVLSVIIAHTVLGPIGWKIGSVISDVVYAGISGSFRVVFGAIFGFVYAPLVITGLHHMSNAIDMQLIADFGGTMLWPMIALSNIAQGSAVLGMIYLQRKNAAAQEVNVPSCISCYLGVTEPAMFGVNLKYHFPFVCGMIGSAVAAVVCVFTSTTANAIGVGGIPGILSIQPAYMLSFAVCMLIAIVIPFVLTVIVGKKKGIA